MLKRGRDVTGWQLGLVALILLTSALLPALASAIPPDPSWIDGIFDNADFDDVVVLALSGAAQLVSALPLRAALLAAPGTVPPVTGTSACTRSIAAVGPRAPPAS